MRVTRRGALGIGVAAIGAIGAFGAKRGLARARGRDEAGFVSVQARQIAAFAPHEPGRRDFGELRFQSGLVLSSDFDGFGGLSGLWRDPTGARLVAVSDNAQWLTARVRYADGLLAGLDEVVMAPILGETGQPLRHGRTWDTESLAMAGGAAFVGLERVNEVRRFDWDRDGVRAQGVPIAVPDEVRALADNDGLEALAVTPPGHPMAGSLIGIAEDLRNGDDGPTRGWVLTGPARFAFDLRRSDGFDVTDLGFLPSGEALLLERRYRILTGVACRIRRLAPDAFRPGAMVDGPVIFEAAGSRHEIDNMEGIATHRDPASGETVVTLASDDNFSPAQRTLLLEFTLPR